MGFKANNIEIKNQNKDLPKDDGLNEEEVVFLLKILKNTTFKGESVEVLYNTVLKLQNKILNK